LVPQIVCTFTAKSLDLKIGFAPQLTDRFAANNLLELHLTMDLRDNELSTIPQIMDRQLTKGTLYM